MNWGVFVSTFLAASIEVIEMVAIVVAVGVTRSWPAARVGAAGGLVVLAVSIAALGATLQSLSLETLRLVVGALLLLRLPSSVFESAVPWLILFACSLVATQPLISRRVRSRRGPDHVTGPPRVGAGVGLGTAACGVYGGYFGAGQGVMMIAVLAFGLELPMAVISALRTAAILASNLVATAIFVFVAPLDWTVVLLLGAGSVGGGYVGSIIGRRLPDLVLRALVVASGVTVAALMLRG